MNGLTDLFKILSDETRLRILLLLYQEALCVCEIYGILGVSQPKVSKHLSKLKDLGFVRDERREKFIYYHLKREEPLLEILLEEVLRQKAQYPEIMRDSEQLKSKSKFSSECRGQML